MSPPDPAKPSVFTILPVLGFCMRFDDEQSVSVMLKVSKVLIECHVF